VIHLIVFSKDRALQLDAALRTLLRYIYKPGMKITVIYTSSSSCFGDAYAKLIHELDGPITWIYEGNFRHMVLSQLFMDYEYTMFYCDDSMMFAPAKFSGLDDDVLCHSLRLGRNTTVCYPVSHLQRVPKDFPKWRYRDGDFDFGYPFSVDSHIFRTVDIRRIACGHDWHSVNTLEASMVGTPSPLLYMTAGEHSCSVLIPHNRVQDHFPNRNEGGSAADLNALFLTGKRIDPFAMDFSKVIAAHWPVPFVYKEA